MICAIYARRSTDDERSAEDGKSIDRQVELARAFAVTQGWAVADQWVVTDDGVSGANFERVGLLRLLEGARQQPRPFDVLVVMSIDRLGREQVRTANVVQQLHAAGITLYTYQDGQAVRFTTPADKLLLGVHNFGAEDFRYQIKLKTTEALRRKATLGHYVGGVTFGYQIIRKGEHSERVLDPEQTATVRRIFELSAHGYGDDRIVRRLATEHVPAPGRAGHWSKNQIRRLLRNECYIGTVIYGQTNKTDDGGHGQRVRVDPSKWIRVDVPELRIISDELWQQVQDRKAKTRAHYLRAANGQLMGKPEAGIISRFMLSGIARCGTCGSTMTMVGAHRPRYFCLGRSHHGATFCSNKGGVPMDVLDRAVLAVLYDELLSDPARLWKMIQAHDAQRQLEREAHQGTRVNVEKEVARLETEIGRLVAALAAGTASADITTAIADRRAQVDALKVAPAPTPVTKARYLTGYAAFRVMLNSRHPLAVRQVLRKLGCDRIVVTRTGEHTWDFAGEFDAAPLLNNGSTESASWAMRTLAGGYGKP